MPRIEGTPEDQPPMSQDEGKGDQPNGQVEQPDPNDPAVAQKALLSLGQSLNQLKAGLQQAGIPPEALSIVPADNMANGRKGVKPQMA